MTDAIPQWRVPLSARPAVALMAVGVHGPNLTERFGSTRHWWLHLYRYTARMRLAGAELPIRPGCVSLIPPGVEVEYDFGERATHLCAHFTLPDVGEEGIVVPALQDLGDDFPRVYAALEEAAGGFAANPVRAEVRLWDILWQIADRTPPHAPPVHPHPAPVERARQIIELRLGEALSVKALAAEVGVSHNHLTRLFHAAVGDTVIGYIRQRRVQRARHLLEHTTLPIKTVAAQVGVEDPRLFYKLIRAHLGCSPRQVRHRA
ncbi:MAG: helix-turn-helix transcriptional regulator [Armatimonadetes bacterium]|nr:helix-turn-helix transcriptional regulator [Armatimonadota bacterium]